MVFTKGHYVDSGLSQKERDRLAELAQREDEKLKSWDDVPNTCEDQEEP